MRALSSSQIQDEKKTKAELIAELEELRRERDNTNFVAMDGEMRLSVAQLTAILDVADDAVISMDEDHCIRMFSEGAVRIFGFTPEEVIGQSIDMLLPEEVRDIHRQHMKNFTKDGQNSRLMGERSEVAGVRKNGERFPAEASISKVHVEGRIIFTVTLRDISARKAAEEAHRKSESLLQLIADTVPANIVYMDTEKKYKFVNKTYTDWMRLSKEDVIGKHLTEIVPPEVYNLIKPNLEQALAGNRVDYEGKYTFPDNITRDFQASYVPTFGPDGTVNGFAGLIEDITDRKQAEEKLRDSQRLLQTVFDAVPHWIYVKDTESRFIMANRSMSSEIDTGGNEIVGMHALQLGTGTEENVKDFLNSDRQVIESGNRIDIPPYEMTLADGRRSVRQALKVPLRDAEGEIIGLVGVSEDITRTMQIELQLRESQKMEAVGKLAGGIAHEFNNMLQIVISCARMLSDGTVNSQRDPKLVQTILKASERSAELTRQLLAFSRKSILRPISLILNELISNQLQLLRQVIGEHIEIEFQANEGLWAIRVDPGIMEQIILNLCLNARDALPDGGRILIKLENVTADDEFRGRHSLEHSGHYVAVAVSDNGIGMSSEVRERIFEPFFSTKEVGKGTGLGLAMVQGAVEQHHGVIEVTSEQNIGTTFSIFLPRDEERVEKQEKSTTAHVAGGSETILVAEDQEDVLEITSRILESKGYKVIAAKNGEEAWTVFKANIEQINLVILDMIMPIKTGRVVFEQIRDFGSAVPVLFHSGYSPDSDQVEFLRNNGLRLLQKPYDQVELFAAAREILDFA